MIVFIAVTSHNFFNKTLSLMENRISIIITDAEQKVIVQKIQNVYGSLP